MPVTRSHGGWARTSISRLTEDGVMNLFQYTPGSDKVNQVTKFTEFHIRSMDAGHGVVVFEQAGAFAPLQPPWWRTSNA